jgi:hypothetical protein
MFSWRYLDGEGQELGVSGPFDDRGDAESWLGGSWADLRDQGIDGVELFDRARGSSLFRMSLDEGEGFAG